MEIEIRPTDGLTVAEQEHIDNWLRRVFGADADDYEWSDVDWHVLVWVDGRLVSHVGIVQRTGMVDAKRVRLGGIGGVATLSEWRGQGLATAAMKKVTAFICDELDVEFGLLICNEDVVPFYQRLGWEVVEGPLMFDQPSGKVTFEDVAMVLSCKGREWPEGAIDLCGLPW